MVVEGELHALGEVAGIVVIDVLGEVGGWKESFMHGIELHLKGRDRFLKGWACWEAPKLRGSLVLLSLIPCPSLC